MLSKRAVFTISTVCIIVGIMISIQFKSSINSPQYISPDKWSELTVQIDYLRKQHDALTTEAIALNEKLWQANTDLRAQALQDELSKISVSTGLTPVQGPGIIVFLDFGPEAIPGEDSSYDMLIDGMSLLFLVNELRAAGAEAISINNERIVAASWIEASGSRLNLNGKSISSPFEIRAIGDPETLSGSLKIRGGELEAFEVCGVKNSIQTEQNVYIPAFKE